jgi:hypothetical protein
MTDSLASLEAAIVAGGIHLLGIITFLAFLVLAVRHLYSFLKPSKHNDDRRNEE